MHRHPVIRLAWCVLGAAAGISLALALAGPPHAAFVLASLGGSSVFLFGLTRAPAAQPRALFGGHLAGALIGIACAPVSRLNAACVCHRRVAFFGLHARHTDGSSPGWCKPRPHGLCACPVVGASKSGSLGSRLPGCGCVRVESPLPWSRALPGSALGAFATFHHMGWLGAAAVMPNPSFHTDALRLAAPAFARG